MKWFKHLTGSLNNSFIFELIEKFGGDGYLIFFGTLELMADEFDIYNPGKNEFSYKKLTKNLQVSRQKLTKIYQFINEKAKENTQKDVGFLVVFNKNKIRIICNRLAKLCDNHTQKLLKDTTKSLQSKKEETSAQEEEVRSKKKTYKSDSIEYRLADYLYKFILKRNPNYKKPDIQKWSKQIDLMIRLDKREPEVIKKVIEWCQSDTPDKQPEGTWKGWANNILSTAKLREKFDKLVLKMQEQDKEQEEPNGYQPPLEDILA